MIRVMEFVTKGNRLENRASHQLENYLIESNIVRQQIISITSNQSKGEGFGDTVMLVYEEEEC